MKDEPKPPELVTPAEEDTPVPRRGRQIRADAGMDRTVAIDGKTQVHESERTTMLPASHRGEEKAEPCERTEIIDAPTRQLGSAEQIACKPLTPDGEAFGTAVSAVMEAVNKGCRRVLRDLADRFDGRRIECLQLAAKAEARNDAGSIEQWTARADELGFWARKLREENP